MTIYMFTGDKGESLFNACLLWYDHRPPDPYNAGTWHVGFSPARRTLMGGWGAYIFLLLSPVILALVTHPYREKDPFFFLIEEAIPTFERSLRCFLLPHQNI